MPPGRLDDAVTVLAKRFDISKRAVISYSIVAAGLLVVLLLVVILIAFLPSRESPKPAVSATFPAIAENVAGDTDNTPPAAPKVDRPKPAVAPFDAIEAKAHQARWAKSLEVPSLQTNSIGMKMLLIPPGEFLMGSPASEGESDEHPQHRVRITKPFWLGVHEVTVGQFRQFALDTKHSNTEWQTAFPGQTDEYPVVNVSWEDANAFFKWLSGKEGKEGKEGKSYRLPTEAEWEFACRAGMQTKWSFGDDKTSLGEYAWYGPNSGSKTHPVGGKKPNAWGLYDMQGNVWEWCQDWYESGYYAQSVNSLATDPTGPPQADHRVLRGGGWSDVGRDCGPADRGRRDPWYRIEYYGFRLALSVGPSELGQAAEPLGKRGFRAARTLTPESESTPAAAMPPRPTQSSPKVVANPPPAPKPALAAALPPVTLPVETNSIGMKLVLIPAGEFTMGSPASEGESHEHPQHRVRITRPFWLGIHEVTVGQFRQFALDTKHSNTEWQTAFPGQTDEHPVVNVSWEDANAFFKWLSGKEGKSYRLPTEAEWESACRAGMQTKWSFGDDETSLGEYAWYSPNSGSTTHRVGGKKPNAWGLYDMQGNVWEWCQDWYESGYYAQFANSVTTDPTGPPRADDRVLRGGCWHDYGRSCRPAIRAGCVPGIRGASYGFRLALQVGPSELGQAAEPLGKRSLERRPTGGRGGAPPVVP